MSTMEFSGKLTPELYSRGLRLHGTSPAWFAVLLAVVGMIGLASAQVDGSSAFVPLAILASGWSEFQALVRQRVTPRPVSLTVLRTAGLWAAIIAAVFLIYSLRK